MNPRNVNSCAIEPAVAQLCRTVYINAGHNIQTAEDIKNSLLYNDGVKNAIKFLLWKSIHL